MVEINIARLTRNEVRNLAGHERGLEARALFNLDELDREKDPVRVVVPGDVYALTTSFFQGMFSASVRAFGTREAFLGHYRFDASTAVLLQIDRGISAVLTRRHSLIAA